VIISCLSALLGMTVIAALIPASHLVALALVAPSAARWPRSASTPPSRTTSRAVPGLRLRPVETSLQFGWVFGGALGVLLPAQYWIGFAVVGLLLAAGPGTDRHGQRDSTLLPWLAGAAPEVRPGDPPNHRPPRRPAPGSRPNHPGGGRDQPRSSSDVSAKRLVPLVLVGAGVLASAVRRRRCRR